MKIFRKIKILIIIGSLLFSTSCWPNWYKPYGKIFKHAPKDGTPGYRLGWIHGCESGLATQFGAAFMMTFYSWKKETDMVVVNPTPKGIDRVRRKYKKELAIDWNNPAEIKKNFSDYKKIFWLSHIFCRHSIVGTYQTSGTWADSGAMNPTLPGQQRFVPGRHNLGNIYSYTGRGNSNLSYW